MKNIGFFFLSALALCLVGCVGDDFQGTDFPDNQYVVGGTAVTALNTSGDFDVQKSDVQSVTYTVNARGEAISGVDVVISHPSGVSGSVGTVTSFPETRTLSLDDALAATGIAVDDIEVGDTWTVTYEVDGVATPASFGVLTVTTFKSALAGEMSAKTTLTSQAAGIGWDNCAGQVWEGTVIFDRQQTLPEDDGNYIIRSQDGESDVVEDISFGAYYPCYAPGADGFPLGDLRLVDVDDKLSITGASQWGEVYTLTNVVTDGTLLSFNWTNDYGEGAAVELTRNDGEAWPDLK